MALGASAAAIVNGRMMVGGGKQHNPVGRA